MKRIFGLLVMCCSLTGVFAQGASFGIKGGLNLAKEVVTGSGLSLPPDARTTVHFGVYTTIMLSGKLGLQPEILYSGQGAGSGSNADKFSYLNIPVVLKYHVTSIFKLQAGPQVGFPVSATRAGTDIKDQMHNTEWSGAFGVGVDLPMRLNFTVRYIQGISDILKTAPAGVSVKNQTIQISAGFRLIGAGAK